MVLGIQWLRELERGVDILIATLGRLVDLLERARVSLQIIRMLDHKFTPMDTLQDTSHGGYSLLVSLC
ncbi:hypothetical protein L1049_018641 [Liquidambar formosana]|uniref:Uncharacterized protein n=1 Tax=Liquidambar formosana TaxID=63359 RepID=A0AAP0RAZ5_LIQFO